MTYAHGYTGKEHTALWGEGQLRPVCCGSRTLFRRACLYAHPKYSRLFPSPSWKPAAKRPIKYEWTHDPDTTLHGTLLLTQEAVQGSKILLTREATPSLSPTCISRQDPFWNGTWPSSSCRRPWESRKTGIGRTMR